MTSVRPPTDSPARPAPRQILTDNVYEAIKALVMDHAIAPGARVNIDALARQLQVSQTPLREALARLESDGLVTKEPLRGYSAAPLMSWKQLDDLYGFRLLVEPWAAGSAATNITDAGRTRLSDEIASCSDAPDSGSYEDYKRLSAHDTRFHDLIMEFSGNISLRDIYSKTHCHLHGFRLYYGSGIGMKALKEHQRIAKAVASGNSDRAETAMRAHLENARKRFRVAFGKQYS
jgi:DNA-binding GntR family transcriptional regulator